MIIYIDVLLFINFIIDIILINISLKLCKISISNKRLILSSVVCSLFSLYIFIPKLSILLDFLLRFAPAFCTALICNRFKFNKYLLRFIINFYAVSFIFAGAMLGIWLLFKPQKMSVNNGIVYFNISPLLLITLSLLFYILILLLQRLAKNDVNNAKRVEVELKFGSVFIKTQAMIDTGFDLKNISSDNIAIIIDKTTADKLFGKDNSDIMLDLKMPVNEEFNGKIRFIQVNTVSGAKLMPAVKIDSIGIKGINKISKPLALIGSDNLSYDFSVILPADIF